MPLSQILSSLSDNPYFGAGFGLAGVGASLVVLKKFAVYGNVIFRRNFLMSLEVSSRDKSYSWLLQWIATRCAGSTQHISVETSYNQTESGKIRTQFKFLPSPGDHYIMHRQRFIKIERNRETQSVNLSTGQPFESVTLTTFGRDRQFYLKILEEARLMAMREIEGRTIVYSAVGHEWRPFGYPRCKRSLESVVLDAGVSEKLHADVQEFIGSSQWYMERGIPYRRGYLLHGPPGCGKSSFIMALAGALDYSISILSLSERTLTDDRLQYLLNVAQPESIILLEDIDAAFTPREDAPELKTAYAGLSRITFSGLLNAIDGVASSEARILFMTTNYPERLDAALVRPGRVDVKQEISHCTDYQLQRMFTRFYSDKFSPDAAEFAEKVRQLGRAVSAAQIQGFFLLYKDKPLSALDNVSQIGK